MHFIISSRNKCPTYQENFECYFNKGPIIYLHKIANETFTFNVVNPCYSLTNNKCKYTAEHYKMQFRSIWKD